MTVYNYPRSVLEAPKSFSMPPALEGRVTEQTNYSFAFPNSQWVELLHIKYSPSARERVCRPLFRVFGAQRSRYMAPENIAPFAVETVRVTALNKWLQFPLKLIKDMADQMSGDKQFITWLAFEDIDFNPQHYLVGSLTAPYRIDDLVFSRLYELGQIEDRPPDPDGSFVIDVSRTLV